MAGNYSQSVRLRVGYNRWLAIPIQGWPCAKLEVTESALIFHWWGQKWTIPKGSIQRLARIEGVFSTGMRIDHSIRTVEPYIVVKSFRFEALERALEHYGYKLVNPSAPNPDGPPEGN